MAWARERCCRPEVMDQPGLEPARHDDALHGLARLNFWSGSAGILWPPLAELARRPARLPVPAPATGAGGFAGGPPAHPPADPLGGGAHRRATLGRGGLHGRGGTEPGGGGWFAWGNGRAPLALSVADGLETLTAGREPRREQPL